MKKRDMNKKLKQPAPMKDIEKLVNKIQHNIKENQDAKPTLIQFIKDYSEKNGVTVTAKIAGLSRGHISNIRTGSVKLASDSLVEIVKKILEFDKKNKESA